MYMYLWCIGIDLNQIFLTTSITYCRKGANPAISDIMRLSPLYHAVLNNHEEAVKAILEFFPITYWVKSPTVLWNIYRNVKSRSLTNKGNTLRNWFLNDVKYSDIGDFFFKMVNFINWLEMMVWMKETPLIWIWSKHVSILYLQGLFEAMKMSKKTPIYSLIKQAWQRWAKTHQYNVYHQYQCTQQFSPENAAYFFISQNIAIIFFL